MNQMVFNQAISYIDTDIVELFFDMKSKKENQVNFRTKPHSFLKWGAIAAVLCFALATSFVMILINHTNQSFNLPTTADNILWYDDNSVVCNESASIVKWNGINVSSDLYEVLNQAKRDKYIAVIIKYRNEDNFNNYVFKGKSYLEHNRELDSLLSLSSKYEMLQKEGEKLKFGELLYTDGLEDGTKWTKTYYDERIAFYGESLLSEFIVNGVFLSEKLENSISQNQNLISDKEQIISGLIKSYDENMASAVVNSFKEYSVTTKNGNAYMFITPSELLKIKVENIDDYSMYLASRAGYEDSIDSVGSPLEPAIKDSITGFAYNKIVFDSLDTQNNKPDGDEAVLNLLNETIEKWRYTYDYVEFTIYYSGSLTEEDFEEMHYIDIIQTNYPSRMIVKVKYADINMEALKDISQMSEIISIHISAPTDSMLEPELAVE